MNKSKVKTFKLILIALVSPFLLSVVQAQTGKELLNKEKEQKKVIPFTLVRNKTILSVKVGNTRPLRIILDSGMSWDGLLIMNPDLNDSILLRNPQNANIGGAGNGNAQTAVFSDSMSFSIENTEFKDQRVVVLQSNSFKGFPSDGVTGYSLFGHYALEVNYDNSTIILHDSVELFTDKSWIAIPIYFKDNNIPWMDVKIIVENEKPVTVACYIDYASSEAIELLLKPDQKFTLPDKTDDYLLGRGLSGDIHGKRGRISKVIIGPFEIKDVLAAFAPAEGRSKQKGADGIISNNFLRRFNLIFDYSNKKIYIKPNSHYTDPF
jgi:hypothetical protein